MNKIDDLGIALLSLKDELAASRKKASQRQEALQSLHQEAETFRTALRAAEETATAAQSEVERLSSELDVERSLSEALRGEITAQQRCIEEWKEREHAREGAVCAACEETSSQLTSLREQMGLLKDQLEEQAEEGRREIAAKSAELETVYGFLREKEEEVMVARSKGEAASADDARECVALRDRLGELEKVLEAVREELQEAKREKETLTGELEGFETKWEEVATLTSDLSASRQQVTELQSEVSRQKEVISEQSLRIEESTERLHLSSEANEELSEEVQCTLSAVLDREGEIRELRAQQDASTAKIKVLEAALKECEGRLATLGEKTAVLEASRSDYKKKYLQGAEALTAAQLEHKIASAKLERAVKDLDGLRAREREGQESSYKEKYMCLKEELQLVRRKHQQAEDKWKAANGDGAPSFEVTILCHSILYFPFR